MGNRHLAVVLFAVFTAAAAGVASFGCREGGLSAGEHDAMREQARQRQRRIIFNNDGDDAAAYRYGRGEPPSDENLIDDFLDYRGPREGSQIDTVFYSTDRGSFGLFSHRTEVGTMFSRDHAGNPDFNLAARMYEMGTDPLSEKIKYCREHDLEIFWSMRMNDTHDAGREDRRHSDFKRENPEYLFARRGESVRHGRWSAVDFAREEVRDFLYEVFREVAENYDIDGIEMDFFRHPQLFRSVSRGGVASDEEREKLTELIIRIRDMLDVAGRERGRPILLAMRVPDSVGYCRDMGIDIERWFELGLIDMYIPSGYFRLNDWEYSVELGRRHGVQVYAGLSETRVMVEGSRDPLRRSLESYRGRAWEAWNAGVDGIYTFNLFNTDLPHYRQLGSPETLRGRERYHFVSVRDRNPAGWLAGGRDYLGRRILTPASPSMVRSGDSEEFVFSGIYDAELVTGEGSPSARCRVLMPDIEDPGYLQVIFNGEMLEPEGVSGQWLEYGIEPAFIAQGENRVQVRLSDDFVRPESDEWDMIYEGDYVMQMPEQLPWRRLVSGADREEVRDGALYLADLGTGEHDMADRFYPWQVFPGDEIIVESRVKVEHSSNPKAVTIRVADGGSVEYLTLGEDEIGLFYAGLSHPMDTTDDFYTYRIVVRGEDIRVYVDGEPALDGTGSFTTPSDDRSKWLPLGYGEITWNEKSLMFGSASGPGTGAAYWDYIGYRTETPRVGLYDVMLSVNPGQ